MERRYWIIASIIFFLLVGSLVYYSISKSGKTEMNLEQKEALAKCLTQKGIFLYGTINCPNCEVQKEKFDEAVKEIVYINCYEQKANCTRYEKQKIYPFWGMEDTVIVGPIPLDKLKERTNC